MATSIIIKSKECS